MADWYRRDGAGSVALLRMRHHAGKSAAPVSASIEYQVPFADTDQMGVVYYANYLIYFEMARAELMRSISFSYTEMEKTGYGLPVLEAVCRYHTPAHFEDKLVITATLTEIKGVRLRVDCTVKRGDTVKTGRRGASFS